MEFRKLFDILVHPNLHILISSYHHINLTERAKCKIYKYTNTKYLEDPTCALSLKTPVVQGYQLWFTYPHILISSYHHIIISIWRSIPLCYGCHFCLRNMTFSKYFWLTREMLHWRQVKHRWCQFFSPENNLMIVLWWDHCQWFIDGDISNCNYFHLGFNRVTEPNEIKSVKIGRKNSPQWNRFKNLKSSVAHHQKQGFSHGWAACTPAKKWFYHLKSSHFYRFWQHSSRC